MKGLAIYVLKGVVTMPSIVSPADPSLGIPFLVAILFYLRHAFFPKIQP